MAYDSASRLGRNVFSLSIRYMDNGNIIERTAGMMTQNTHQTGINLAEEVKLILKKFDKTVNDVYAICSDGGRNMVKTAELLKNAQDQICFFNNFMMDDNEETLNFIEESAVIDDVYHDNDYINNFDNAADAINMEVSELLNDIHHESVPGISLGIWVNCSAHILQLASRRVSKMFEKHIKEVRAFVQESRKIEHNSIFNKIKKPRYDVEPRWDSTFLMIESICDNRKDYESIQHSKLKIKDDSWAFIDEFHKTFLPIHKAMMKFQEEKLTLSM